MSKQFINTKSQSKSVLCKNPEFYKRLSRTSSQQMVLCILLPKCDFDFQHTRLRLWTSCLVVDYRCYSLAAVCLTIASIVVLMLFA